MRPESEFLAGLHAQDEALAQIPCYSYRTPMDLIIVPATSSQWASATNRSITCIAHPLMVLDRRVADSVVEDLK